MAIVRFTVNQLAYRDPASAQRFEQGIAEALAGVAAPELVCKVLAVEGNASAVRIQLERPGWVKVLPPLRVEATAGEIRALVDRVLRASSIGHDRLP
jgi:hypothetical protein